MSVLKPTLVILDHCKCQFCISPQVINVSTWILASASSENKMGSVCSGWLWKMWHEKTGAKFEWCSSLKILDEGCESFVWSESWFFLSFLANRKEMWRIYFGGGLIVLKVKNGEWSSQKKRKNWKPENVVTKSNLKKATTPLYSVCHMAADNSMAALTLHSFFHFLV